MKCDVLRLDYFFLSLQIVRFYIQGLFSKSFDTRKSSFVFVWTRLKEFNKDFVEFPTKIDSNIHQDFLVIANPVNLILPNRNKSSVR